MDGMSVMPQREKNDWRYYCPGCIRVTVAQCSPENPTATLTIIRHVHPQALGHASAVSKFFHDAVRNNAFAANRVASAYSVLALHQLVAVVDALRRAHPQL